MSRLNLRTVPGLKLLRLKAGWQKTQKFPLKNSQNMNINSGKRRAAFTLVECLLGLSLSIFILLSSVEMLGLARRFFLQLKNEQEIYLSTANALEKIREDAEKAGLGLEVEFYPPEEQAGGFSPVLVSSGHLLFYNLEEEINLEALAEAGQNFLTVYAGKTLADKLKKGRSLLLQNLKERKAELFSIVNFTGNRIYLNAPLGSDYKPEGSRLCLLEKVDYFLDQEPGILRRRVNDTTSQPLLEETRSFAFSYSPNTNVLTVRLTAGLKKEKTYELVVFPKNIFKNPWL